MKKINLIVGFLLCFGCVLMAQNAHKDFFVGKWDVTAVGTPGGNSRLIVDLKRVNGKLEGQILREGKNPTEISKVEETPTSVKVYFRHNLFKVNLLLTRKDDNHTVGSLMGKYNADGVRLK